jgi:hypothetical protein
MTIAKVGGVTVVRFRSGAFMDISSPGGAELLRDWVGAIEGRRQRTLEVEWHEPGEDTGTHRWVTVDLAAIEVVYCSTHKPISRTGTD